MFIKVEVTRQGTTEDVWINKKDIIIVDCSPVEAIKENGIDTRLVYRCECTERTLWLTGKGYEVFLESNRVHL